MKVILKVSEKETEEEDFGWDSIFGFLKKSCNVYAGVIEYASREIIISIITQNVSPDSFGYRVLCKESDNLYVRIFNHFRINHVKLFADKKNHINGIENFLNQAKRHMQKFNGIPKQNLGLFLKECEWRFNNKNPKTRLHQLTSWVKPYL